MFFQDYYEMDVDSLKRIFAKGRSVLKGILVWRWVSSLIVGAKRIKHAFIGRNRLQHAVQVHEKGRCLYGYWPTWQNGPIRMTNQV